MTVLEGEEEIVGRGARRRGLRGHGRWRVPPSSGRFREVWWVAAGLVAVLIAWAAVRFTGDDGGTVRLWSAKHLLLPGQRIVAADLVERDVPTTLDAGAYVHAERGLTGMSVVHRPVAAGELVPRTSIAANGIAQTRVVPILLEPAQSRHLRSGAYVQLWVARKKSDRGEQSFDKAEKLVEAALVGRVTALNSHDLERSNRVVEVQVPADQLSAVLDAVNADARVVLAGEGGPLPS